MKFTKKLLLFLTIFAIAPIWPRPITKFSYHIELTVYEEYVELPSHRELEKQGWRIEYPKSEYAPPIYRHGGVDIPISQLPLRLFLGSVGFTINKTIAGAYKAYFGMEVGDYDSSSNGYFYLHYGSNVFLQSGGNHSAGTWGFRGKAIIHLK